MPASGAPSHAAAALEMGADAVLVNTAIAVAGNPVAMAVAFKMAVEAGRMAYEARLAGPTAHCRGGSQPRHSRRFWICKMSALERHAERSRGVSRASFND